MEQNQTVTKTRTDDTPRIYVASSADYNTGRLLGRWIDADQGAAAIHDQIAAMLAESGEEVAEDWAIHDYENFAGLCLSEFEDIDRLAEAAFLIAEHGGVFAALAGHFGGTCGLDEARRYMEEGYRGAFSRLEDYVEELLDECYGDVLKSLPEFIRCHLDFEGMARDLELGGDVFTLEAGGMVHVFDGYL